CNAEMADINLNITKILCQTPPSRNCADLYSKGCKSSEPAKIFPYSCCPDDSVSVLCDHVSDGSQWTIIQRRQVVELRENFNRSWADYVQGFGELEGGEFWIGLKLIHELTTHSKQELHIALEDWDGDKRWAKYGEFSVGPAEDNYKLKVTGYTGDAGDAMKEYHNGQAFSTFDRDNDSSGINCAERYASGWWYNDCGHAYLNGVPNRGTDIKIWHGIIWHQWRSYSYSLKSVTMKIRPAE
ncbi:unnamed protein product, partial [Meganyctiphanes norvegica]